MEIFLYNKSELFVELSLFRILLPFIYIDDVPLLMKSIVSSVDTDVSVLLVNITNDFHNFSSFVDNIMILESEHLPPSGVGCCASEIVRSTIALNI